MINKQKLRKWVIEERKNINIEELSCFFVKKIQEIQEYKIAKNIMIFYPLKYEINLLELLKDKNKNFYLPKIENKTLLCCPYKLGDKLCKSCVKTLEPITNSKPKEIIDLVIVPALAVDKSHYRLGYGGGFYDRFLADLNTYKIVCIPKEFYLENVFPEPHDIKINKIITT
ncbi:5-formyltetrahydrofolate cyclo-ligase [bacterium]|nr:5-formyltetrahydrofolate cyclo-ligase [bacterium]